MQELSVAKALPSIHKLRDLPGSADINKLARLQGPIFGRAKFTHNIMGGIRHATHHALRQES
jgi:hypothetical protein